MSIYAVLLHSYIACLHLLYGLPFRVVVNVGCIFTHFLDFPTPFVTGIFLLSTFNVICYRLLYGYNVALETDLYIHLIATLILYIYLCIYAYNRIPFFRRRVDALHFLKYPRSLIDSV